MFSEHTLNRHAQCVLFALKIFMQAVFFLINVHTCVNFRPYKVRKISSLVDFHSLYQLLHPQVYRNGLKLWISNVKICIDNCDWLISASHIMQLNKITEKESNRKLLKMLTGKNLRMTQKSFMRWFSQKKVLTRCVKQKNHFTMALWYFRFLPMDL